MHIRLFSWNRVLILWIFLVFSSQLQAQVAYSPYSYQHYQKYNDLVYDTGTRLHTSVKPYLLQGALKLKEDSLSRLFDKDTDNLFKRKLYNEHLIQVDNEDYNFYLDFLPDFLIGSEMLGKSKSTWLNTRGFQMGLSIGDKFTFYTNAFENQGVFADYLTDYVTDKGVMPGQGTVKHLAKGKKDWMYATASLTYAFSDYIHATFAYDKNHIGDGYRSLLLSDFSSNYTHLKLSGKIGNVQYTSVWAYMLDPTNPRQDSLGNKGRYGDGIKWGAFQYLDYNATNRLSIGFFQAVIWANKTEAGRRGFDFNYLNPVIFLRPVESTNSSSPDKMFLGLNAKYKILKNLTGYGQFLLGEFTAKEFFAGNGYAHNKWGAQIGLRGYDFLGVKNLNFLTEYNMVRPYTYQHFDPGSNYSNKAEPLAHPYGANFREVLAIANYSWKRFDFSLQGLYALKGTDPDEDTNMGGDIFKSYRTIVNMYGNSIGQGVKNNLYFADAKVSYVLNPKYNLRFELGYTQRYNKIAGSSTQKSGVINIGLRSSFRNFYADM